MWSATKCLFYRNLPRNPPHLPTKKLRISPSASISQREVMSLHVPPGDIELLPNNLTRISFGQFLPRYIWFFYPLTKLHLRTKDRLTNLYQKQRRVVSPPTLSRLPSFAIFSLVVDQPLSNEKRPPPKDLRLISTKICTSQNKSTIGSSCSFEINEDIIIMAVLGIL